RKNRTDEALHNEFEKLTKKGSKSPTDEIRLAELKGFMSYTDSLQWGGGPEFKDIASKISQGLGTRISSEEVASAFSTLHMREVFINGKNELHSFNKINESLETYVAAKSILKGGEPLAILAKRWTMKTDSVARALIIRLGAGKSDIKKVITQKSPKLPDVDGAKLISFLKSPTGGLKSKTEFFNEVKEEAELFHTLSPLPPLKGKNDKKGAYLSLGLNDSATEEQIKKQYKKLARLKHPDRLKGKGIPQEFESIATENFTQIKEAYDILMKG
ncbi:MAG: J domain-containing protein, partial [Halobacteriovoraceae bacterium]|nr:J domain-containing protein [Halobacteriovoraceae bacterium]